MKIVFISLDVLEIHDGLGSMLLDDNRDHSRLNDGQLVSFWRFRKRELQPITRRLVLETCLRDYQISIAFGGFLVRTVCIHKNTIAVFKCTRNGIRVQDITCIRLQSFKKLTRHLN